MCGGTQTCPACIPILTCPIAPSGAPFAFGVASGFTKEPTWKESSHGKSCKPEALQIGGTLFRRSPELAMVVLAGVNVRPAASGPMQWSLLGAAPWKFDQAAKFPESCSEKNPCTSRNTPAMATGQYQDATEGIGIVVPTAAWYTPALYFGESINPTGGGPIVRKQSFGVILDRPLRGLTAFHFSWYFCAGSWDRVKNFTETFRQ